MKQHVGSYNKMLHVYTTTVARDADSTRESGKRQHLTIIRALSTVARRYLESSATCVVELVLQLLLRQFPLPRASQAVARSVGAGAAANVVVYIRVRRRDTALFRAPPCRPRYCAAARRKERQ